MRISTEIGSIARIVEYEKAIELVGKAGFDCFDFSMFDFIEYNWQTGELKEGTSSLLKDDYKNTIKKYLEIAKKYNITCNQAHAPFPSYADGIEKYIIKAIECASLMGAKIIVIHPMNDASIKENTLMFKKYLKYAHKYNIKIASENMWDWDNKIDGASKASCSHHQSFLEQVEDVNDPYLVACVDVGHASIFRDETSPYQMIKTLGKHVQCLHLHDVDLKHDNHQIPFSLKVDFSAIVKALKEVDYEGDLTLEADSYISAFKDDPQKGVIDLKNAAEKIRQLF